MTHVPFKSVMRSVIAMALVAFAAITSQPALAQTADGVTPDARLAANAMVIALRDMKIDTAVMPVRFEPGVREVIVDPKFKLNGFFLNRMLVERYTDVPSNPTHRHIVATVMFQDLANRGVMITFSAKYRIENGTMVIYQAVADYVSPVEPVLTWYVVPANKVPGDLFAGTYKLAQIHYFIAANGLGKLSTQAMNTVGDYYIFGMMMDRLAHDDKLTFRASVKRDGAVQPALNVPVANIGGWRIATFRARFAPKDIGKNVVLFAQHQPGTLPGKPAAKNKMIAITKAFEPNPLAGTGSRPAQPLQKAAPKAMPAPAQAATQPAKPVVKSTPAPKPAAAPAPATSSERLMLNNPAHVRKVQQRLQDLGFFKGAIDGKWGKSSRTALRAFKAMNGLEDSFIWDDETQEVLFP